MTLEGRTMINVDDTGFNLSMRESQGRSKIGVRAQSRVPAIRSRNINVMAATHNRAMTFYQILEIEIIYLLIPSLYLIMLVSIEVLLL
jgi:hypothetical protein